MIIYQNTLSTFIDHCFNGNIDEMIKQSILLSGLNFGGASEIVSWQSSLPFVAKALNDKSINSDLDVAIEYKLDVTKNRVDFLIYGKDEQDNDSVVIVELKQRSSVKNSERPNYIYTYGGAGLNDYMHPSYQAFRYLSILKGFNEFIQENDTLLNSCSYMHNLENIYDFIIDDAKKYPFILECPVFLKDDENKLREFVKKYVSKSNKKLLYEIDNSKIRPSKDFSIMLSNAIKGKQIFSLDDEQAASVSTILFETNEAIKHKSRKTIIIRGGPGTGKSVVAINALGQLIHPNDGEEPKNACYCTSNFTPRTLFSELLIEDDYKKSSIKEIFKSISSFSRGSEFDYDCIFLDEAHRAYKWKFGSGVGKDVDMIDKLFYSSRVNVFFIDEDQAVTSDDFLTIQKIKDYANKYNSEIIEKEELHLNSQFRCLGGQNYMAFINTLLGFENTVSKYTPKSYEFKVFDSPSEMWDLLKSKQAKFSKSRILSGYTHEWVSKNNEELFDFDLENGKFQMKWNKFINNSYINDPSQFDRIGCIHTIQGVDMDFAGVIIGKDMYYKDNQICFDQYANAKSDKASHIRTVDQELAKKLILNTYRVLLTRAVYGTYVYCEDKALAEYIKRFFK